MSQSNISQAPATVDMQAVEKRRAELRERAGRFRVLIIGRANAGKTTILKKVCNTTDDPEIYTKDGQRIDITNVEPSAQRGLHDIESEMVFRSNPTFIFHDSRGFEAGGVDELKKVNDFVLARSKAKKLRDQIHVIWYCIPMDDDRPITHAEQQFFSRVGTGKVPLIAVFTKCEALEINAIIALEDQGCSFEEATEHALEYVQNNLKNTDLDLQKMRYPPQGHVYLQKLNKPDQQCLELVECTVTVLDSDILQAVFISTQQNNLELSMKYSLEWGVKEALKPKKERMSYASMFQKVMIYFPYYAWDLEERDYIHERRDRLVRELINYILTNNEIQILSSDEVTQSLRSLLEHLSSPLDIQTTNYSCALSIIAEHLIIICNQGHKLSVGTVSATIFLYQQSVQCGKVTEAVQRAFFEYQMGISTLPEKLVSTSKKFRFKNFIPKSQKQKAKNRDVAAIDSLTTGIVGTQAREKLLGTLFEVIWAN